MTMLIDTEAQLSHAVRKKDYNFILVKYINNQLFVLISLIVYGYNFFGTSMDKMLGFYPLNKHEVWRYFTYAVVHEKPVHIISNIVCQVLFGFLLEKVHGFKAFLIFLCGVLAGSLASGIFDFNTILVGSSGGVFALALSTFPSVILDWEARIYMWNFVTLLIAVSFLLWEGLMMMSYYTSHVAHIAGAITGALTGVILFRSKEIKKSIVYVVIRYICCVFLVFAFFACVVLHALGNHT